MKMYKRYKPELVLDRKSNSFSFKHLYLDAEKSVIVATNGVMLVKIPVVVGKSDVSGYIQAEVIERARNKADEKDDLMLYVKALKKRLIVGDAYFDRPGCIEYVDYEGQVISKLPPKSREIVFGVNLSYLDCLRESLGVDSDRNLGVFFSFDSEGARNSEGGYEDVIRVFLQTETKSTEIAVIMPRRWHNNNERLKKEMRGIR